MLKTGSRGRRKNPPNPHFTAMSSVWQRQSDRHVL